MIAKAKKAIKKAKPSYIIILKVKSLILLNISAWKEVIVKELIIKAIIVL